MERRCMFRCRISDSEAVLQFSGGGTREARCPRSHSDYNLEQPSDEMELADNLTHAHPSGLPLPNRMHRFVTLDRAVGSPERAEALARSHPPLDGPMILLQDVIKVWHRPQSTSTPQHPFCLQLFNDWRVGRILIHIDDSRRWVVR